MTSGRRGADRRIAEALAAAGLSWGARVSDVLAAVADHRLRPVQVSPLPADVTGQQFGVVLPYPDRDDVLYRPGSAEVELHNVIHLCAHLLLDHVETQCTPTVLSDLAQLLPDLPASLVADVLSTTTAAETAEAEAEAFVSALHGSLAA